MTTATIFLAFPQNICFFSPTSIQSTETFRRNLVSHQLVRLKYFLPEIKGKATRWGRMHSILSRETPLDKNPFSLESLIIRFFIPSMWVRSLKVKGGFQISSENLAYWSSFQYPYLLLQVPCSNLHFNSQLKLPDVYLHIQHIL